jgi:hypothetical protein
MIESSRQTHGLAVCLGKTRVKAFLEIMQLRLFGVWKVKKILCRACWRKRTTSKIFAMHFFEHTAKSLFAVHFFYRAPRSTTCSVTAVKQDISRDENAEMEEPQSAGLADPRVKTCTPA